MSAATAIGMVSESIQEMLLAEWSLTPELTATILTPDEPAGDRRVNLCLYRIAENPYLKNLDWQVRPGSAGRLVPPPLSLKLFYLLTAYAPNDPRTGNATAQGMLGEAMRVMYENPVLPDQYLVSGLRDAVEEIRIVHVPLDLDEASRIWSTFGQPYRASACYEVSVVQIDPRRAGVTTVPARVRHTGVPEPRAPFHPPVVTAMTPESGPPGTRVELTGRHLAGWRADVRVTGSSVLQGFDLAGDSFAAALPGDLEPGMHHVRVDVSGLFRRVFLFEVA
ncbi:MAG TPA: Pvc16 family protein [Solirubrobacteraceae bacterium]|nr:Pvc16 family protein [Solirubrobacteraceae bacterium]